MQDSSKENSIIAEKDNIYHWGNVMIELNIRTQPNDETCGPTSLHAIYHYYGKTITLNEVIEI